MSGGQSRDPKQQRSKISVVLTPTGISNKEIKVKAAVFNASEERRIRFSFNGSYSSDCVRETKSNETEFVFPVPSNTLEAKIKAEIMDGSRYFDEITVAIPQNGDKQPTAKSNKDIRVQISSPDKNGVFFISIFTAQEKERIFISSPKRLTITPKRKQTVSGNQFVFSSGPDKILFLEVSFEDQKTSCFFNGQKRMLIK